MNQGQSWTDIRIGHRVVAAAPESWRAYLLLARADRPVGAWLLGLPCLVGLSLAIGTRSYDLASHNAGWWVPAKLAVLFIVGAFAARALGCIVNDLFDRQLDRQVERTRMRPLASGAVSPKAALVELAVMALIGLVVLTQLSKLTVILALASVPMIITYPLAKRVFSAPQCVLGFVFSIGGVLGWTALTNQLTPSVFLLYGASIVMTICYDTIYACQDRDEDQLIGAGSLALTLGRFIRPALFAMAALAAILLVAAPVSAGVDPQSAILAMSPGIVRMFFLVAKTDFNNKPDCLRNFQRFTHVMILNGFGYLALLWIEQT